MCYVFRKLRTCRSCNYCSFWNFSSKAIDCQWICVIVCRTNLSTNFSKMANPKKLTFEGEYLGVQMDLSLNSSGFDQSLAGKSKKIELVWCWHLNPIVPSFSPQWILQVQLKSTGTTTSTLNNNIWQMYFRIKFQEITIIL